MIDGVYRQSCDPVYDAWLQGALRGHAEDDGGVRSGVARVTAVRPRLQRRTTSSRSATRTPTAPSATSVPLSPRRRRTPPSSTSTASSARTDRPASKKSAASRCVPTACTTRARALTSWPAGSWVKSGSGSTRRADSLVVWPGRRITICGVRGPMSGRGPFDATRWPLVGRDDELALRHGGVGRAWQCRAHRRRGCRQDPARPRDPSSPREPRRPHRMGGSHAGSGCGSAWARLRISFHRRRSGGDATARSRGSSARSRANEAVAGSFSASMTRTYSMTRQLRWFRCSHAVASHRWWRRFAAGRQLLTPSSRCGRTDRRRDRAADARPLGNRSTRVHRARRCGRRCDAPVLWESSGGNALYLREVVLHGLESAR